MKSLSLNKILISILMLPIFSSIWAQSSSYKFEFDSIKKELLCIETRFVDSDEKIEEIEIQECLKHSDKLITPLKNISGDDDKCYTFIDESPFYFVGEALESSLCKNQNKEKLDLTPNIVKYSEIRINHLCTEIGKCLTSLSSQSQEMVDDTLKILNHLKINTRVEKLKESVDQDQLDFTLPSFLNQLDLLEKQNEQCHNNLTYGKGDSLAVRNSLATDLSNISGVLKDDLYVFHWYEGLASNLATSRNGDTSVIPRIHARMLQDNYFSFDIDEGTGYQGRGLYASPGPRETASYGNILLKIKIPKGSKYLDMKRYNIPLSEKTIQLLKKVGCELREAASEGHFIQREGQYYANKIAFSATRACRKVYNDVIKEEKYIFHSYNYSGGRNSVCDQSFDQALVLIQNKMSAENVTSYRNPFDRIESEMSAEVKDLYDLSQRGRRLSDERKKELHKKYRDHLWQCEKN